MDEPKRDLFPHEHAYSIKEEREINPAGLHPDPFEVQTPARAAISEHPFRHAKLAANAKRKAEWSMHPSAGSQEQVELGPPGTKCDSRIPPILAHHGMPSSSAGTASGSSKAAATKSGLRTESWAKILSSAAGHPPKKHNREAIVAVPADMPREPGPSGMRTAGLGKQAAYLSARNEGESAHYLSPRGRIRRATGAVPKLAKKTQPTRTKQTSKKSTSSKRPVSMRARGAQRDETDDAPSSAGIQERIHKMRPLPFGMLAEGSVPFPQAVDDPEEVRKQGDLVQNIYSHEVFEEYRRRCAQARGKAWSSGVIPEVFLDKVTGEDQHHTDMLRHRVVDQITHWLSLPLDQRRRQMNKKLETVVLNDMSHPAYRRFKEYYEPLGLRSKERSQQYKKDMPEWTLLGEYTGVWDSHERSLQRISGDPMGLGTMRRDKVTELAYAGEDVSEDVHKGLRIKWVMSLEIDASRAQNRLSLINDCANVPGYDNQPNVVWLECEDSRTLQPHLFLFTACAVRAGQEALLDYGPDFHRNMEDDLKRAAVIVVERQQRQGAEDALHESQEQLLLAQAQVREREQQLEELTTVVEEFIRDVKAALDRAKGLAYARPDAKEAVADAPLVVSKPLLPACQTPVHLLSAEEEEEQKVSKAKGTEVAICVVDGKEKKEDVGEMRTAMTHSEDLLSAAPEIKSLQKPKEEAANIALEL